MHVHNSSLTRTLPPPPPPIWHHRRPNIAPLMKSTQWNYGAGLDAHAYPSPPMTTSPTSPKRSQFAEDRLHPSSSIHEVPSITSAPSTEAPRTTYMASQLLPAPAVHPHPYIFGAHPPGPTYGEHQDLHARSRAQSIPSYQGPYQSTSYGQPPMMAMQHHVAHLAPAMGGPVSMASTVVGRIPRSGSRRAKAHVARACQNCKKAHLSCDEHRPCTRCVSTRKESTCVDVEHKKRGRPRIQPERGQSSRPLLTSTSSLMSGPPHQGMMASPADYRGLTHDQRRGSLPVGPSSHPLSIDPRLSHGPHSASPEVTNFHHSMQPESPRWRAELPPIVAFLSLDLRIIKAMDPFKNILCNGAELSGHNLESLVDPRHRETLRLLQNSLRTERMHREPTYLPAIGQHEEQAVQQLNENDVERITQGSVERIESWTFHIARGRSEAFLTRMRLARTTSYFAVLELQRPHIPSPISSYPGRPQTIDLVPNPYGNPHTPRETMFAPVGPGSPFARSAPASPFSSLPQHLMTSLPPTSGGTILTSAHPSISPNRDVGLGNSSYFPRQAGTSSPATGGVLPPASAMSMQPPPQPQQPSIQRSNTTRDMRRPDPLTNVQLPPIGRTSAPTTPVSSTFYDSGNTSQHSNTPAAISPLEHQPGSTRKGSPNQGTDEEANRKRRRLNIGEIIEK